MTDLVSGLSEIMRAEIKNLDSIANNTANANTPGFRAEYASLKNVDFLARLQPTPSSAGQSSSGDLVTADALTQKKIQQNDGTVKATGVSSHVALRGSAWFVIEKDNHLYLTRNGMFKVDSNGNLKTATGGNVMGEAGPIGGLLNGYKITADGKVMQSQKQIDQLKIVTTPVGADFVSAGNGLYETNSSFEKAEPTNYSLISGAYEVSNIDTATDMIRLMQTTRHIETIQRSISAYDQLLNVGINQLGK